MSLFSRGSATPEARNKRKRLIFKSRPRPAGRLRLSVQLFSLAVILVIGLQFARWVGHLSDGRIAGSRPPGVEGFLPISAMISLKHLIVSSEFSMIHPAGLVLFTLICLTALLLRKAFCSWICPVGVISEYLSRASHKVFKRRIKLPAWLDYPFMSLKYLLLAFFAYAVFYQMSPHDIQVFLNSPYNKVADIKMLHFFTQMSSTTMIVLGVLTVLSFLVPWLWCRYLCPYGALLGLLSMLSPMKIRRTESDCTSCGKCSAVCPSFINVDIKDSINSPECTGCLECVSHCPEAGALQMSTPKPWRRNVRPAVFAVLVVMLFYGGINVAKVAGKWRTEISDQEFLRRVQELDSPKYHHAQGKVPEYTLDD
jgi:polyferredoxin